MRHSVEPMLTIASGSHSLKCRICGRRADLVVRPGYADPYPYCARCVNDALERAEIAAARGDRV